MRARSADAHVDQKTWELGVLKSVAETLNRTAHVEEALHDILQRVAELLALDSGWVWLVDAESGRFFRGASYNLPPYLEEPLRMTGEPCWCIQQFHAGELTPRNISILSCSRLKSAGRGRQTRGLRFHASVPLVFQDRQLGIMNLTGPSWRKLSGDELRLLSTIGSQLGMALERARLAEEGRRLARADERARMARDVHDSLAQTLTAVALGIEGAQQWIGRDDTRAAALLERALQGTRSGIDEVRRSVADMRIDALAGRPLEEAIATLARGFTSDCGIPVRLRAEAGEALPLTVEAELFRIAQEALTNVMRHAKARKVEVDLVRRDDGGMRLSIRDDGRGFDVTSTRDNAHGVRGMRERARRVGGRFRISSEAGRGTRITVSIDRVGA